MESDIIKMLTVRNIGVKIVDAYGIFRIEFRKEGSKKPLLVYVSNKKRVKLVMALDAIKHYKED